MDMYVHITACSMVLDPMHSRMMGCTILCSVHLRASTCIYMHVHIHVLIHVIPK